VTGSKSKQKGSSFEREIANSLSKLYNDSFVRAAHSGAFIGGSNNHRKSILSENQIKSFKGDIIPPDSWNRFNAEAKSYADFPFHLLMTGDCKVIDGWIKQLMDVAETDDCSILFMKFNRKGKFVAVESKFTWVADNFIHYRSETSGEWIIMEHEHFFRLNKDLLKLYSGSTDTKSDELLTLNISPS
jgi:predicted lipase